MGTQLGLPIQDRVRKPLDAAAVEIRAACRAIARRTKQGEVLARAARMDPGNFSKALDGKVYKLDVDTLPAFFFVDEERVLIQLLCRLCGGVFVERPKLSVEERFDLYRKAVESAAPAVAEIARRSLDAEEAA
jgi:hypothetical protein